MLPDKLTELLPLLHGGFIRDGPRVGLEAAEQNADRKEGVHNGQHAGRGDEASDQEARIHRDNTVRATQTELFNLMVEKKRHGDDQRRLHE